MRIAIVGSGISGLTAAWLLRHDHEVTVFEANAYVGGHANTVDVEYRGERQAIDTGFIVHNDRTYPNLLRLFAELGVATVPTAMSFSVRCDRTGLEYNGTSLNGMFSQRSNILRPGFYRMIRDILRFNREAPWLLREPENDQTVGEYLQQHHYGQAFAEKYLLPMGAAIWSCPTSTFRRFPIRFIAEFYWNHGLLSLTNRPEWRVVEGGSREYVRTMLQVLGENVRLNAAVESVERIAAGVRVQTQATDEVYDEIVFACHSDQALRMLADPSTVEAELLSEFPYNKNVAVLHADESVLPKRRRAWASWNYHIGTDESRAATVTYCMNILQHIDSEHTFSVTLNEEDAIDAEKILGRFRYSHPVYTTTRGSAQARHSELIRGNRTSFCGAYWGNGFHEDGVVSALAVCRAFGRTFDGPVPIPEHPPEEVAV